MVAYGASVLRFSVFGVRFRFRFSAAPKPKGKIVQNMDMDNLLEFEPTITIEKIRRFFIWCLRRRAEQARMLRRRQNCPEYGEFAWIWPRKLGDFASGGTWDGLWYPKSNSSLTFDTCPPPSSFPSKLDRFDHPQSLWSADWWKISDWVLCCWQWHQPFSKYQRPLLSCRPCLRMCQS